MRMIKKGQEQKEQWRCPDSQTMSAADPLYGLACVNQLNLMCFCLTSHRYAIATEPSAVISNPAYFFDMKPPCL